MSTPFDLSLGLEGTHILVTGGCGLIGSVVVSAFLAAGANVSVLDLSEAVKQTEVTGSKHCRYYITDISNLEEVHDAFTHAEACFGTVKCCIALASIDLSSLPQTESICDLDPEVWRRVMDVNVNGTFFTAQRWLQGIRNAVGGVGVGQREKKLKNVGLVMMGSEAGSFGVRGMAAYAAGKSAVQGGLLLSLSQDAPRIFRSARVNAVAPGAVDTSRFREECEQFGKQWEWEQKAATVPMAKAVGAEDVARTFVFLASEKWSGSTHGQVLEVNAGKTGSLCWERADWVEEM